VDAEITISVADIHAENEQQVTRPLTIGNDFRSSELHLDERKVVVEVE
jgi:hypothetical protein